jgi:DNA-binding NtrC family response regulator
VNVRVLSATNTDLRAAIAAGTFREDLYFRLNVIELRVPPLADRIEDVRALVEHFLEAGADGTARRLSEPALAALEQHDWSGNVRELENRIQRALLVARGDSITAEDLDLERQSVSMSPPSDDAPPGGGTLSNAERQMIEAALVRARGVVSRAASELGLSRQALYRRMERLGIEIERRPKL